ncbi:MAG: tetraacyldisaccharide 4'-kinase, partial [Kangiellaceae bacterium]|nr:tetraacyldisaccharide 4'-kinase [Kangiellaceae bacterium]
MSTANKLENFWYSSTPFKWLLWPLSFLISLIARLKRALYKAKVSRSYRSPVPVVIVGNITVGGTGKTPLITYLVNSLIKRGLKVGIVSRGYKSQIGEQVHYVSTDDSVDYIGDEAFMQSRLVEAPLVIGANRSKAVKLLLEKHSLDLIISDDGLQHYKLDRDYEILLVDGN